MTAERVIRILDAFDPERGRKKRAPRPFMIELCGTSNSGKTTLLDKLYIQLKADGFEFAKSPEGAEAVPPPRVLPVYNFRTADYAVERARAFALDKNIHVVMFDRAIFDAAVRMEKFFTSGLMTAEERDVKIAHYLDRWNRDLFDLHVCLVTDPDTALTRRYGADHATTARYSTTTNPESLQIELDAHVRTWERLDCASDPKMLWRDTSSDTTEQTFDVVLVAVLAAYERRLATIG